MDQATLIERAEKLLPELSERAPETEALRQLPAANVRALIDSGLTRALQPEAFGGSGLGARAHVALTSTLGAACPSTAWCQFVWSAHSWLLGIYPAEAQHAVWDDDREALISASLAPVGQAEGVDGGIRLSGRWAFASGCDHAEWLMLGAVAVRDDVPSPVLCLVPRRDVEIIDTWHVMGLRGTGSQDIHVEGAFVADAFAPSWLEVVGRNQGLAVTVIAGPVLGAAEGAVARFRERLVGRTTATMQRQKDQGVARQRLAESAVEVDAARLLLERNAAEIDAWNATGQAADPPTLRWIRDTGFAAELCARATQRVFEASGGSALRDSEPIQRFWRDVHAGHAHAFLNWDTAAEAWATGELGAAGG